MNSPRLRAEIEYMVGRGWIPAIEHAGADSAAEDYWCMWKLPMFGETNVDRVLTQVEACRRAWPGHLVRLIGYDNGTQSQGAAMVVHRPARRTGKTG